MFKVLSIAGSDCSGGAGIQADLKTFAAHKVYGMSVITAVTAQNTCRVTDIQSINQTVIAAQMDAVFTDIYPDAVKIGMLMSAPIIETVVEKLKAFKPSNIVLDTVMVSTSGHRLLDEQAVFCLRDQLMPLADIITPNIPEAEVLCGFKIDNKKVMIEAAEAISAYYNGYVLIKGGHLADCSDDLLYNKGQVNWFESARVNSNNTHGTGCTLSSAIAANLAMGFGMVESVKNAKDYVWGALSQNFNLGKGNGPLNHCYCMLIE